MKSTHHMNLGGTALPCFLGLCRNLGNGHLKRVGITLLRTECTELTAQYADVRVIDISVEDIGRHIPVFTLTDYIGHKAESVQIP